MKKHITGIKSFTAFILLLIVTAPGIAQQPGDPYKGIEDQKVLPMLKHLPYSHGGMNIPATDGRLLYDLIVKNDYKRGLEIGTSNGYSGLWLGLAFQKTGGKLITIEIEPRRAKEARKNFIKARLSNVIDSRINDAFREIPTIKGEFDFVFIDAWKPDYLEYYEILRSRIKPGGAITAHNVMNSKWQLKDFLDAINKDPRLETKIVRSSRSGVSISILKK